MFFYASQELEQLMGSIQYACKTIANLVSRAGISDLTGLQVPDHDNAKLSLSVFEP